MACNKPSILFDCVKRFVAKSDYKSSASDCFTENRVQALVFQFLRLFVCLLFLFFWAIIMLKISTVDSTVRTLYSMFVIDHLVCFFCFFFQV